MVPTGLVQALEGTQGLVSQQADLGMNHWISEFLLEGKDTSGLTKGKV